MNELTTRNEMAKGFRWRTMKGEILTLDQMDTRHMFNCLKMLYNHLAQEYGFPPVWFIHHYSNYHTKAKSTPKKLLRTMVVFISEIERRGDLGDKWKKPYYHIIRVLCDLAKVDVDRLIEGIW